MFVDILGITACPSLILSSDVFVHAAYGLMVRVLHELIFDWSDDGLLVLFFLELPPWTLRRSAFVGLILTVVPVLTVVILIYRMRRYVFIRT